MDITRQVSIWNTNPGREGFAVERTDALKKTKKKHELHLKIQFLSPKQFLTCLYEWVNILLQIAWIGLKIKMLRIHEVIVSSLDSSIGFNWVHLLAGCNKSRSHWWFNLSYSLCVSSLTWKVRRPLTAHLSVTQEAVSWTLTTPNSR